MSVWTLIVENIDEPENSPYKHEAQVMYGPPDSKKAWKQAEDFLFGENPSRVQRIIGLMKGNFGNNFYTKYGDE